jgi:hypothetical protein
VKVFGLSVLGAIAGSHLLPPTAKAIGLINQRLITSGPITMESTDFSLQAALVLRWNAADHLHRRDSVGDEAMLLVRGDVD